MKQNRPIILFRIGYMESYNGKGPIFNGGGWVKDHQSGGEMWNFRQEDGMCYGFVMTRDLSGIDLSRIDSSRKWSLGDEMSGVDIVFFAKKDGVGQIVVGWYNNATVYHKVYRSRQGKKEKKDPKKLSYLCEVESENAVLLEEHNRKLVIPYAPIEGKGFPGNSQVWYGDSGEPQTSQLLSKIRRHIKKYNSQLISLKNNKKTRKGWPAKPDKDLISKIEEAAVNKVWGYYKNKGYIINNVQNDYCGWDLTAEKEDEILQLEIKGHKGNIIQFELTPNEYENMKNRSNTYRVCVVRNALTAPKLDVFIPHKSGKAWILKSIVNNGTLVLLNENVAARATEICIG